MYRAAGLCRGPRDCEEGHGMEVRKVAPYATTLHVRKVGGDRSTLLQVRKVETTQHSGRQDCGLLHCRKEKKVETAHTAAGRTVGCCTAGKRRRSTEVLDDSFCRLYTQWQRGVGPLEMMNARPPSSPDRI